MNFRHNLCIKAELGFLSKYSIAVTFIIMFFISVLVLAQQTTEIVASAQMTPLEKFVPEKQSNQSESFNATNGSQQQQQPFMGLQQTQQRPLSQPPMQQQQGILPQGMRPILLDNLKQSPMVLATLDLDEKLTLVVQTYNYCGNPPGGILPGQDGEKCRQFLSLLDQTLINMLSLPTVTQQQQQQNFQNTPDFTKEDEEAAAVMLAGCTIAQSVVGFQSLPSSTKAQCDLKMIELKNKCILHNNMFSICAKSTTSGESPLDRYLQREGLM